MFTRSSIFKSVGAAALVGMLSFSAFADTIRLKDGSIIKGQITGFTGGKFTIVIGEGQRRREMVFTAAEVESIMFDKVVRNDSASNVPTSRTSTPPRAATNQTASNTASVNRPPARPARNEPTNAKDPEPAVIKSPAPAVTAPVINASSAKPIELGVKVLADNTSNGWTNSGWVVKKGQRIRITGSGKVNLGGGRTAEPGGLEDDEDSSKLLKRVPTGALIAVIGDDNNDFLYVGISREFIAERDGSLFLGVNEGNLNDNSGTFDVKIEIIP